MFLSCAGKKSCGIELNRKNPKKGKNKAIPIARLGFEYAHVSNALYFSNNFLFEYPFLLNEILLKNLILSR